ncbi:MAG: hypothetical protein OJF61_002042 [Rhodanobacteraceae bacterium]|jgi:hypothetical protein|nr:MAG: hypothetical protein OJF61_002042 [Rhodanobacteraceae bacterium]
MPVRHGESASVPVVKKPVREIRWDAAAAVVASLVGLLALLVAAYTAYIQRQQVRAQVWPYLMWANSDSGMDYLWINKGVGPAIIRNAVVLVDGKPQHDWNAVMRSMQVAPQDYGQSTFNHNVISAGETLEWIKFKDHDHFLAFRDASRKHLAFKVCYCSTLGDCWVNDSTRSDGNNRIEVGKCPAVPDARQFDD